MADSTSLLLVLTTLASLVAPCLALVTNLVTGILLPLAAAIILGVGELISSIVASVESVTQLILEPAVLLFPLALLRRLVAPLVRFLLVALAPVVYPLEALLVFVAAIAAIFFEFKALYTFLATAAVLGLFIGSLLHLTTAVLSPMLGISPAPAPQSALPPRPVLHATPAVVVRPAAPRAPIKSSLRRHRPVLRKHIADGPGADTLPPRRVKFTLDDSDAVRPRCVKFTLEDSGFHDDELL